MTKNETLARKIACTLKCGESPDTCICSLRPAYFAALKAAELKDNELRDYLKEKCEAFDDDKGYLDEGIRRSLIEEIYRELFNENLIVNSDDTAKQNND